MMVRFGFQPCLAKFAKPARLFKKRDLTGERIVGSVDPPVMMIAANDPDIGFLATAHLGDNIVDRLDVPVEGELEMNFGRARAKPVGYGQSAAPGFGHHRALHRGQQGLRIAV